MKKLWFKKAGWVYYPVHVAGYFITAAAIIFMVPVILAADRNSHSVSDELYEIFVYATCTFFGWNWVAENTSE